MTWARPDERRAGHHVEPGKGAGKQTIIRQAASDDVAHQDDRGRGEHRAREEDEQDSSHGSR